MRQSAVKTSVSDVERLIDVSLQEPEEEPD
jgi:hypothetical protein